MGWQQEAAIHYKNRAQFNWLLRHCDGYDMQIQFERSLEDYNTALELAPDQADWYSTRGHLHYALAELYEDKGRSLHSRRNALQDLETAARLDAGNARRWRKLAQVADIYDDHEKAVLGYQQMIQLPPDTEKGYRYRELARRLYRNGDYAASMAAANQATELLPQDPIPYFTRGLVHTVMGDPKAAMDSYWGGIALAEDYAAGTRKRKYDTGLEDLKKATDITPTPRIFLRYLLEKAKAGELHDYVCKVVAGQPDAAALYAEPGTADGPVLGSLVADAKIRPLARSADAGWIYVEVEQTGEQTGERGWIPAGEESVTCKIDLAGLPVE
jgi:tetratricopeptide (TPR) repeat protein